jgi:uncharacterized protein (DUF58 family)
MKPPSRSSRPKTRSMGARFRNVAAAMLVLGAALKRPPVTVLGAFLLGVVFLARVYSRLALGDIAYTRKLSSAVAFPGDLIDLTITVENRKPLAVPLVSDDEVPGAWQVSPMASGGHHRPGRTLLHNEMSLGGFETITRKFTVECPVRGEYYVGPATLSSGDPFGLYPVSTRVDKVDRLTVYPRLIPVENTPKKSLYPFGTSRARSWTYRDPSLLKMVRQYVPGDSVRHMDWKATARSGNLQTRVFDATFGDKVVICLDLSTSRLPWEGINGDTFESLVVGAASLCQDFHKRGFAVGLTSNGVSQSGHTTLLAQCPPGTGDRHLVRILSLLAGLRHYTFGTAVAACSRQWVTSAGTYPVILTSLADEGTLALVKTLRDNAPRAAIIALCPDCCRDPEHDLFLRSMAEMHGITVMRGFMEGGWDRADAFSLSSVE